MQYSTCSIAHAIYLQLLQQEEEKQDQKQEQEYEQHEQQDQEYEKEEEQQEVHQEVYWVRSGLVQSTCVRDLSNATVFIPYAYSYSCRSFVQRFFKDDQDCWMIESMYDKQ